MSEQVKTKVELNRVTHSVRAAQAVLQYGVGAMADFPDQTLITAAPEYWTRSERINDERFAKALGEIISRFRPIFPMPVFPNGISVPSAGSFNRFQSG